MGLTVLEIEVGNPAKPKTTEKLEFLIDSGAIYPVVPKRILKRLKIKPIGEQTFRLADGSKIVARKEALFSNMAAKLALLMLSLAKRAIAICSAHSHSKHWAWLLIRCGES
jgi:hypothetical protein